MSGIVSAGEFGFSSPRRWELAFRLRRCLRKELAFRRRNWVAKFLPNKSITKYQYKSITPSIKFNIKYLQNSVWIFTFTLDCHLGKTHDHRSRGDTTWRAHTCSAAHPHTQTNKAPHTHTWTLDRTNTRRGGGGVKVVKERSRGGHLSRSRTFVGVSEDSPRIGQSRRDPFNKRDGRSRRF